ncbi:hypothetical protein Bb109J_c1974 [Bdellovibrio bacteriovorus]|uniref:hypothetical protein n=1 Tax=Bdellovibrio bacteriovorus TaxID=959 RepID=UPI00045C1830|nr:hypothetical protein [Bdellovibrio bacteriovorus]AHZ84664.1 hypothetical protein EP01_06900 [Bdellovibrio bacteriovorus]BEV68554.1 hypothetical protein Bb109J_c1974 [Bdellovibrio bacteriovorus]
MTTQEKAREFWIREPVKPRKGAMTIATEIKPPWDLHPPLSGAHWLRKPAFKAIESSAYQKAVNGLKRFGKHSDSCICQIGHENYENACDCGFDETFKELGEL